MSELAQIKDDFVTQWGALGSQWGINRTMAQIHALLLIAPESLSAESVMEDLQISRGKTTKAAWPQYAHQPPNGPNHLIPPKL